MITTLEEALEQNKVLLRETFRVTKLYNESQTELKLLKESNSKLTNPFLSSGDRSDLLMELDESRRTNSELKLVLQAAQESLKNANQKLENANMKFRSAENLYHSKDEELGKLKFQLKRLQNEDGSFKQLNELAAQHECKDIHIALLDDRMIALERLLDESQQEVVKLLKDRSLIFEHAQNLKTQLKTKDLLSSDQGVEKTKKDLEVSMYDNQQLTKIVAALQEKIQMLERGLGHRNQQQYPQSYFEKPPQTATDEAFRADMFETMKKMQSEIKRLSQQQATPNQLN